MNLSICNTSIRNFDGLYSLNDLHVASGNDAKHKPANFLRNQQTIDLIELLKSEQLKPVVKKQGLGTFVTKELVYAYAMWISAVVHLKVIRAFDSLVTQPKLESKTTVTDRTPIRDAVNLLVSKAQIDYSVAYKMVNGAFGTDHIEDIPKDKITEAVKYVHGLVGEYIPKDVPKLQNTISDENLQLIKNLVESTLVQNGMMSNVIKAVSLIDEKSGQYYLNMVKDTVKDAFKLARALNLTNQYKQPMAQGSTATFLNGGQMGFPIAWFA